MSDTLCIMPWTHLIVTPNGTPSACNWMATRRICQDGVPMSVAQYSLAEIWNSEEMRGIRRDMVAGKRPSVCAACFDFEDAGGASLRKQMNEHWGQHGFLNEENQTFEDLKILAVQEDYRLPMMPTFLELDVGNQCNLKCRMCAGGSSSRIARDPTHAQWASDRNDLVHPNEQWYRKKDVIDRILQFAGEVKQLHIIGGEPFIIKEVGDILQHLIDSGTASRISLSCHTNATTINNPWLQLTEHLKSFSIWASIDGYGPYLEYIRYPAKWATIVQNIETLRQLPNATVSVLTMFQTYNALNIVDLFRYFDYINLSFIAAPVFEPLYLRASILPWPIRRLAAERLRAYGAHGCRPENLWVVDSLAAHLEDPAWEYREDLMQQFMLFTNDLDATRGQSFQETHAELLDLITAAGVAWPVDTLYAPRRELPVVST